MAVLFCLLLVDSSIHVISSEFLRRTCRLICKICRRYKEWVLIDTFQNFSIWAIGLFSRTKSCQADKGSVWLLVAKKMIISRPLYGPYRQSGPYIGVLYGPYDMGRGRLRFISSHNDEDHLRTKCPVPRTPWRDCFFENLSWAIATPLRIPSRYKCTTKQMHNDMASVGSLSDLINLNWCFINLVDQNGSNMTWIEQYLFIIVYNANSPNGRSRLWSGACFCNFVTENDIIWWSNHRLTDQ